MDILAQLEAEAALAEDVSEEIIHQRWLTSMQLLYVNFPSITIKQKKLLTNYEKDHEDKTCICGYPDPKSVYYRFLKKFKKRTKDKPILNWITIRPKKCTEKDFKNFIRKFLNTVCIEKYYAAFEWKPNGKSSGLHAHIICKADKIRLKEKIYKIRKGTTYKNIGKMSIDNSDVPMEWFQDKIDYCNGKTQEVEKNEQKKINPGLRIKYDMPNFHKNLDGDKFNLTCQN